MRVRRGRHRPVVTGVVLTLLVVSSPFGGRVLAGNAEASKDYLDKATAAFALSRYPVAAENFEKAYELSPDPALLYNAAQSYRLAGNKQRALELYQSYLRMYGSEKREEIEKHVDDLKKAIEHDHAVATSPPVTTESTTGMPPRLAVSPPPSGEGGTGPVLISERKSGPTERPLTHKTWFWVAVGGGVAVAAAVTLLLAFGGGAADPSASIGRAAGN